jgi:outer membrane murein-binding lipoprotein Lpp
MNNKNKLLLALFTLSLFTSLPVFSANGNTSHDEAAMQRLAAQADSLEQEVQALRAELRAVKARNNMNGNPPAQATNQTVQITQTPTGQTTQTTQTTRTTPAGQTTQTTRTTTSTVQTTQTPITALGVSTPPNGIRTTTISGNPEEHHPVNPAPYQEGTQSTNPTEVALQNTSSDPKQLHLGLPVTTSPYVGLRTAYDASDLIINYPTMNEDLRLLQERQVLDHDLAEQGLDSQHSPYLILSGAIEGQAVSHNPFKNQEDTTGSLNLSRAELDSFANVGPWAQGFMSFSFDNSPLDPEEEGTGNPINNSRLFLQRGFLTIGNLDRSPLYFTIGQMYVPFGRYLNYLLSDPATKLVGRTTARAALLGLYRNGLYASVYAFNGASMPAGTTGIDDFGGNVGLKYSGDVIKFNVGGGGINNIADSILMQNTGQNINAFQGFSETEATEQIVHRVPGADVHGELDIGKLTMISEFVSATQSFDPLDLTFDGFGAKPRAFHNEMDYTFNILKRPSLLGIAYDESWQSLALGLPKNSYFAIFSTSIWKNTIESLELRHDVQYPSSDTAGGRCDISINPSAFCLNPPTGGTDNAITGQIGVYF